MKIIPVIDLLQGRAVQARFGLRQNYRPLNSPLCTRGEVLPLVRRLSEDYGFTRLYLADLNAIMRQEDNLSLLASICADFPQLELWIDAGFQQPGEVHALSETLKMRAVIGSENWRSAAAPPGVCPILSIDSDAGGLRDPSGIVGDAARRPGDLILMNLSRVGSHQGPDLALLQYWQELTPFSRLYCAGGVRDIGDLLRLQTAGAAGVLLASALHHGNLHAADLARFS